MADILISGLTAAAALAAADVLEIDTGTLSRKVTGAQVQDFVLSVNTLATVAPDGADIYSFWNASAGNVRTATLTDILGIRTITAGTGISGGGTLAADRTLNLDLNDLTSDTPVATDTIAFYDVSGADTNKCTITDLQTVLNSGYTASRAVETSAGGVLQVSAVTTAELAILDGLTTTTAELNVLDGSTATTNDFNEIAGIANDDQSLRVYLENQTVSSTGAQTLGLTHQNSFLYMTNASTTTWTIPPNSTTAFNVGTEIEFWRSDASVVITEGSGVTLNGHDGTTAVTTTATIGTQHTGCCIKKVATDTWVVFGRFTGS